MASEDDGMDLNLQKAIYEIMINDTVLNGLVGGRIYEETPANRVYPHIVFGGTQENDDSVQCLDGSEIFHDIHVWTDTPGYSENKRISKRIKQLIHNQEITMDAERCVDIQHRITRTFEDYDITIKHGIVTFRALLEITSVEANPT